MTSVSRPSVGSSTRVAWTTPGASNNYRGVRGELGRLGHAGESWDTLAFSLGLLPTLFVHGAALERVAEIFSTPVFTSAASWSKGAWVQHLPAWRAILADWDKVRRAFPGVLDPRHRRAFGLGSVHRHPLRGFGIDVAPLVSALIDRHQYRRSSDSAEQMLAARFGHLQAMLTAAAIDYRWLSGTTVDDYLDWMPDSRHEFNSFPIESHRACRAVRWLGKAAQAPFLERISQSSEPREFVREVRRWEADVTPADADLGSPKSDEDLQRQTYPAALCSYFSYWPSLLAGIDEVGRPASPNDRGEARGGRSAPDGQIPPDAGKGPKRQLSPSPTPPGTPAGGDSATGGGIAKEDDAPVRLPLVPVGQIDAILSGQKWRAMRAAMAATVTPFDLRYLAAHDADRVARHSLTHVEVALASSVPGHQDAENALLALLTLSLGQPPAVLSKLRLSAVQPSSSDAAALLSEGWNDTPVFSLDEALDLEIDAPVLLVRPEPHGGKAAGRPIDPSGHPPAAGEVIRGPDLWPAPVEAVAFLLPALRPDLAGTDAEVGEGRLKQTVRNLLVPACETGRLLWKYHRSSRTKALATNHRQPGTAMPTAPFQPVDTPDSAIGVRLFRSFEDAAAPSASARRSGVDMIEQRVTDFLNAIDDFPPPAGHERWSARLLQDLMPAHVEAATGDRTLAWLLSCDPAGSSQARMYYTQHTLARLAEVWMLAMHSAGLGVLAPPNESRRPVGGTSSERSGP